MTDPHLAASAALARLAVAGSMVPDLVRLSGPLAPRTLGTWAPC